MTWLPSRLRDLSRARETDRSWRPAIFHPEDDSDVAALERLLKGTAVVRCRDTMWQQLRDLMEVRSPSRDLSERELDSMVREHLDGRLVWRYGAWVFYPWSGELVHVLPARELRELRFNRNLYKITAHEQEHLACPRIGFVGLSVGLSIATTMAMEGVGGEYRLADFDVVGITNMNRMHLGMQDLGLPKVFLAAREMFELDPYLDIHVFQEPLTSENVAEFLLGGEKLDLLIEECDDLFMKFHLRKRAREYGIPLVMYTSDRELVDIERFDKEPERPPFHGLAGDPDPADLRNLKNRDKVPFVLRILDERQISTRLAASLPEVGESISGWTQLASSSQLGAGLVTNVSRRILLGELQESGRYYVDVDEKIQDGAGAGIPPFEPMDIPISAEALAAPVLPSPQAVPGTVTEDDVKTIVEYGIWAPSGGNCQPWSFSFKDGLLRCMHEEERSRSFLDFEHCASYLSIGAAVENMVLSAASMGIKADVQVFPEPKNPALVSVLELSPDPERVFIDPLFEQITHRVTNRKLGPRQPLEPSELHALHAVADVQGARLQILQSTEDLSEIGSILGVGDRLRFFSRIMHRETMAEIRWNVEEVERTRDGLDLATFEFSPADVAALKLVSSWPAMMFLAGFGGGKALEKPIRKTVSASSAMGLLTVDGVDPVDYFRGGRIMQRVWLQATALGLAFQPTAPILYLFARLERGAGEGFSQKEKSILTDLRIRFRSLFQVPEGHCDIMLFRLARAEPPTARSLRRRLDDMLTIG